MGVRDRILPIAALSAATACNPGTFQLVVVGKWSSGGGATVQRLQYMQARMKAGLAVNHTQSMPSPCLQDFGHDAAGPHRIHPDVVRRQ